MGVMMKNKNGLGLSAADFLWSGCVVAPLVVTYWRGTWDLLEDWVSTVITSNTMAHSLYIRKYAIKAHGDLEIESYSKSLKMRTLCVTKRLFMCSELLTKPRET